MDRRHFLGTTMVAVLSGCADVQVLENTHELGETVEFPEVHVTVTAAMTAREVEVYLETMTGENAGTHTAPSNAIFALFRLEVHNPDITEHSGPAVNTANYDTLSDDDDTIYVAGVNDVRVYGGSEGGHIPETEFGTHLNYDGIRVNGADLAAYPAGGGGAGPTIEPTGTVSGWTFGLIPEGEPPRLKIQFDGQSAMWAAESADFSTPTPPPETISM